MSNSLEKMRNLLTAKNPELATLASKPRADKSIYRHWEMALNATATIRFLPDGNTDNSFFWVERDMIKLPFAGIKGKPEIKPLQIMVPCMQMYDEECPVLQEVRTWMKDPTLEEMARHYWKKRSYFYQGFVRESPFHESDAPQNPIRQFIIGPQIHSLVLNMLMHRDLLESPCDIERGMDFTIKKNDKSGYANYDQSYWTFKESALSKTERKAVDVYGLKDLGTRLPPKPTADTVRVISEMFEASIDGELYDADRWAQYFAPYGLTT
jgi:hypothetical protein